MKHKMLIKSTALLYFYNVGLHTYRMCGSEAQQKKLSQKPGTTFCLKNKGISHHASMSAVTAS